MYETLVKTAWPHQDVDDVCGQGEFWVGGNRMVRFPRPRKAKEDDPKTVLDCFNLWLNRYYRVSHARFRGEKVTVLEHIARKRGRWVWVALYQRSDGVAGGDWVRAGSIGSAWADG